MWPAAAFIPNVKNDAYIRLRRVCTAAILHWGDLLGIVQILHLPASAACPFRT
jgi:hypothetical protein